MTNTEQPPREPPRRERPGAMTMAMQAVDVRPRGPKVLRIGMIHGGRIVAERIVCQGQTVTVGSSECNDVVVKGEGAPARFELFQAAGDGYLLNFSDAMSGRVGQPGGVLELDQLRQAGAARQAGGHWQVRLNDTSRGKVVIAGTTLLFQFVLPPAVQPRPQLPAAARAGVARSIDWLFTAFVVATFMTMFGFLVYLENADWPVALGIATVPDEFALVVFEEPTPPPEKTDEVNEGPSDKQPDVPADKPRSEPQQKTKRPDAQANAPAREDEAARIAAQAAQAAEALMVGVLGDAVNAAIIDVLAGGPVPGRAQDVLSDATGVAVASSQSGMMRDYTGGNQGSGQRGLGALIERGGPAATAAQHEGDEVIEGEIRGRTQLGSGGDIAGSGDFDASIVVQQIKARIGAIKACYERELKSNPTLAGKVAIEFTIEERGSVSGVKVTDNTTGSPAVGNCVANEIQRVRFHPGPEGGSVTFSYPFVFAPQG